MAWITTSVRSSRTTATTSRRFPAVGPEVQDLPVILFACCEGVLDRVDDVEVADSVLARRSVDVHVPISYRETLRGSADPLGGGLPSGHVGDDDVGGVLVEVRSAVVVADGGPRVGVSGGDLDISEGDAALEEHRNEKSR